MLNVNDVTILVNAPTAEHASIVERNVTIRLHDDGKLFVAGRRGDLSHMTMARAGVYVALPATLDAADRERVVAAMLAAGWQDRFV